MSGLVPQIFRPVTNAAYGPAFACLDPAVAAIAEVHLGDVAEGALAGLVADLDMAILGALREIVGEK